MNKVLLAFLLIVLSVQINAQDRITGKNFETRSEILAKNGMVASSHPLATQIGLDILKEGGNAVDAAIAVNAALGLMEPTGSGIGGDLFAIVWSAKDQKLCGLNASGRSPSKINLQYFKDNNIKKIPAFGPLPVTVPGCVDGWFELHNKFGSLKMKQILSPAINYANEGFPVSDLIGYYLGRSANYFKDYPNFKDTYMPNEQALQKGDLFKNPYLAKTYETIAKKGRKAFYNGELTKTMVEFLNKQGSLLSEEDFSNHKSEWVEPISTNYRGYDIWELPPNGQGTTALQILNIMEGYDVKNMGFGSQEYIHHFVEAKKIAFEDRSKYYADPAFNKLPTEMLISKEYAEKRRKEIGERSSRSYEPAELKEGDTVYLTVADKDGNMVSLIQSNYRGMGSGMVAPKLGFMFQDRGEMFSLEEDHFNVIEGSKRPFHTIIPAFITKDGKPYISFGLMGGAMQPQGHAQVVMNIVDFGMNLQEAGDAPRIQHTGSSEPTGEKMTNGGKVELESGFDYDVIKGLMKRGHKIQYNLGGYGGYQAIMLDEKGIYHGASESRKDGQAAGF